MMFMYFYNVVIKLYLLCTRNITANCNIHKNIYYSKVVKVNTHFRIVVTKDLFQSEILRKVEML